MLNIFVVVRNYDESSQNLLVTLNENDAHEFAKSAAGRDDGADYDVQRWVGGELISGTEYWYNPMSGVAMTLTIF